MSFEFIKQKITDIILIKPKVYEDSRGLFMETYKKTEFVKNGILENFVQDNYSFSNKHVLRGLHFQSKPYEQSKLIRCTKGKITDVVVDLRPYSMTFKQYLKVELSEDNKYMLYVPKGFAHGFVVLSDFAEVNYKTSSEYNYNSQFGINWLDEELNIDWGIDFVPILSSQDKNQPNLSEINLGAIVS